jgi:hypothetical protein
MHYYEIREKNIPAWYELSLDNLCLIIHLPKTTLDQMKKFLTDETPIVKALGSRRNMRLLPFVSAVEEKWGFGSVIMTEAGIRPDWVQMKLILPLIGRPLREEKNDKIAVCNWPLAFSAAATLKLIFEVLVAFPAETTISSSQLTVIEGMNVAADLNGGAFSVLLSRRLIEWIRKQIGQGDWLNDEKTAKTMRDSFYFMFPPEDNGLFDSEFHVWVRRPKWLNLSVPGNACGLDPEDYSNPDSHNGYSLLPHNVDTPLQQLSILIGLAKIHELARYDGY